MIKKPWLVLLGILLLGFVVRVYRIQSLPMYGDELTMVYDTYSIAKTGMDSTGQRLPLTFRMGSGRPGGYIYFSVPFVAAFGPTVWGVRALSLLSGLGIILLMYFLGRNLFGEKVGLVAGLLAAISPWDIYLSRAGFEAHFALFLALFGITMFAYKKYFWWAVFWGIAILTYPTFKLTLPLLGLVLFWMGGVKRLIRDKNFVISLAVLALFGALVVRENLSANSEQRFLTQNILADQRVYASIIQRVNNERTISDLPEVLKPVFINREIEYGRMILENYIKNLSPDFLVLRGDGNPRHNPGEMGMIYLIDLPLILIALAFLWAEKRKEFFLILKWILITPLATMFFPEAHALRNNLMLPALILLSAFALTKVSRRLVLLASALMVIQLLYILVRIYFIAPAKFASFWSAEAQRISATAIEKSRNGEHIVLSTKEIDNIEYAYEVYAKIDPKLAISQYGVFPKVFGSVTITDK